MGEFLGQAAILCGLPKSGKSTYAQKLKDDGWVIVCPDTIRLALHGQQFEPRAEPLVWAIAEVMSRSLLMSGYKVVIDATNTTAKRRSQWLKLAREFRLDPEVYVMDTSLEECHERNKFLVQYGLTSVPSNVIDRMAAQWEPPDEEGISVFLVSSEW